MTSNNINDYDTNDLRVLDDIEFRVLSVSDEKFCTSVPFALPKLLERLRQPSVAVRNKVIAIVGSIKQRITKLSSSSRCVQIDPEPLVALYQSSGPEDSPFLATMTMMFLRMAFSMASDERVSTLLPQLLVGIGNKRTSAQQSLLLVLFVQHCNRIVTTMLVAEPVPAALAHDTEQSDAYKREEMTRHFPYLQDRADEVLLLRWLLEILLYTPSSSGGLSLASRERIENLVKSTGLSLPIIRENVAHYVSLPIHTDMDRYAHNLIAASVGESQVIRRADNILQRLQYDTENQEFIQQLVGLFIGRKSNKLPERERVMPVPVVIRQKIMAILSRSRLAAANAGLSVQLVYSGLFDAADGATVRLQLQTMNYLTWMVQTARNTPISVVQLLVKAMLNVTTKRVKNANSDGTAVNGYSSSVRGRAYGNLAHIATAHPHMFVKTLKMVEIFYGALERETDDDVCTYVNEGLKSFYRVYQHADDTVKAQLKQYLSSYTLPELDGDGGVQNDDARRQRATVHTIGFVNHVYPFSDVRARTLNILMTTSDSVKVSEAAENGLNLGYMQRIHDEHVCDECKHTAANRTPVQYPEFPDIVQHVTLAFAALKQNIAGYTVPPPVLRRSLDFMEKSWIHSQSVADTDPTGGCAYLEREDIRPSVSLLLNMIDSAFECVDANTQLTAARVLARMMATAPLMIGSQYVQRIAWTKDMLLSSRDRIQNHMANIMGFVFNFLALEQCLELMHTFTAVLVDQSQATNDHMIRGAILGLGTLVQQVCALEHHSYPTMLSNAKTIHQHATYCNQTPPDATTMNSWPPGMYALRAQTPISMAALLKCLDYKHNTSIQASACDVLSRVARQGRLPVDSVNLRELCVKLVRLGKMKRRQSDRLAEHAIGALGSLGVGDRSPELLAQITKSLIDTRHINYEEVQFAIGRACADVIQGGGAVVADDDGDDDMHRKPLLQILFPKPAYAIDITADDDSSPEFILPADNSDDGGDEKKNDTPNNNDDEDDDSGIPEKASVERHLLTRILKSYIPRGSRVVRSAACVWLLNIVKYAGTHPYIVQQLTNIQVAFTQCLTESHQFTQECASKGLAVMYEIGPDHMKEELVKSLVKTFSEGTRKITDDTQIMVNSDRGESASYRELVTVARDMGQPDLVYKFMDLAAHHSIWNSKAGAAFGLGSIMKISDQLAGQLESILPKLYRYQFDPNDKIKHSMKRLWGTMVDDPDKAVRTHFNAILGELLASLKSRQWRNRESAANALCALLKGVQYTQVKGQWSECWTRCFWVLDDVKDTVRVAAVSLSKCLTAVSVRLCDPVYTNATDGEPAVAETLPTLLSKGLGDKAKEVRAVAVNGILKVVKVAGKRLRPHLPELLRALLEGLSTLEPQVFSYLQFHTAAMDVTPEQLEQMRLSVNNASPLNEAVQSCVSLVDSTTVDGVAHVITDIITTGVGLPTLTATAKFLVSVCTNTTNATVLLKPHSGAIVKALLHGLMDQSPSLRKSYANALGYVVAIAKTKRIQKLLDDVLRMYTDDVKCEDEASRSVAALTMRSIAIRAPDTLKKFGCDVLPLAFLGTHDPVESIAMLWTEAWEECTPGMQSGLQLYMNEVITMCTSMLDSSSWLQRQIVARTLDDAAGLVWPAFVPYVNNLLPMLLSRCGGRLWVGKEGQFDILRTIAHECRDGDLSVTQRTDIVATVAQECRRKKRVYRIKALVCLKEVAECFNDVRCLQSVKDVIESILMATTTNMATDDEMKATKESSLLHATCLDSLSALWPHRMNNNEDDDDDDDDDAGRIHRAEIAWYTNILSHTWQMGAAWNVRVAILGCVNAVFQRSQHIDEPHFSTLLQLTLSALDNQKYAEIRKSALTALESCFKQTKFVANIQPHQQALHECLNALATDENAGVLVLRTRVMSRMNEVLSSSSSSSSSSSQ